MNRAGETAPTVNEIVCFMHSSFDMSYVCFIQQLGVGIRTGTFNINMLL